MRKTVTVRPTTYRGYNFRVRYPGPDGKAAAKFFVRETDARAFAKEHEKQTGELGRAFGSLTTSEQRALSYWRELCRETADTPPPDLIDVLRDFGTKWKANRAATTVAHAVDVFLATKESEGASPTHLQSLKTRCERFAADFADRKLATVTTAEISKWVLNLKAKRTGDPASATTKRNHRLAISNLFSFARSEAWIEENPVAEARKPKKPDYTPEILTAKQTEQFVHAIEGTAPEILPFWAVRVFGGLRRSEAAKMDWRFVDFDRGEINMPGRITKTGRPRTVSTLPALRAFLEPFAADSGPFLTLTEGKLRGRMNRVRDALPDGFPMPDNFARHGFGTYHALAFRHAGETAAQLGHSGDPNILFQHYTAEANAREADAFWRIRPAKFSILDDGRATA